MASQQTSTPANAGMSNNAAGPRLERGTELQKYSEQQDPPAASESTQQEVEKRRQASCEETNDDDDDDEREAAQPQKPRHQLGIHEINPNATTEGCEKPRDYVTGRMLSDHGRACLRCMEKSLICTLNFMKTESDRQCAACRRSNSAYCVRFKPMAGEGRALPHEGPAWSNPNFVAGTADDRTPAMPTLELQRTVREFLDGTPTYVMGHYLTERDVRERVLPRLQDDPVAQFLLENPEDCAEVGWKALLPLGPRQVMTHEHVRVFRKDDEGDEDGGDNKNAPPKKSEEGRGGKKNTPEKTGR